MSYLLNYADERRELDDSVFDNIEDIVVATIRVDTGDETLTIVHRNGEIGRASMYSAFCAFYDGEYDIIKDGRWVVDRNAWDRRETSYDFI